MPGIGELIEGAVQQAPQPGRQPKASGGEVMGRSRYDITVQALGSVPVYYLSALDVLDSPYPRVYIC